MELRALSVKQPWASLLVAGVKRFEVRSWKPRQSGIFLIHASSGKADAMPRRRKEKLFQDALRMASIADEREWILSAFVGAVEVTRIWEPGASPRMSRLHHYLGGQWDDQYGWEIGAHWQFAEPVSCHGKLNLWTPPVELHRTLRARLAAIDVPLSAPPA